MTDTRPLPPKPDGRAVSLIFGLAVVAVTVAALAWPPHQVGRYPLALCGGDADCARWEREHADILRRHDPSYGCDATLTALHSPRLVCDDDTNPSSCERRHP